MSEEVILVLLAAAGVIIVAIGIFLMATEEK